MKALTRRELIAAGGTLFAAVPGACPARRAGRFPDLPDPDFHFNTFFVSWGGTTTPEFLKFVEEARPEIVQIGFYGPMMHGYAHNPACTGYPMQLPAVGQREVIAVQRKVIEQVHRLGSKVVSHFQMVNVIHQGGGSDHNFLDFWEKHWPEDILGPKPHPDYRGLFQRDKDGTPIIGPHHQVNSWGFCPSSPYARETQRRMLKVALDSGVDGIITNYNYGWNCVCRYCQAAFKRYLTERFTPAQIRARFGIRDLAAHRFERLYAQMPGYPDQKTAPSLDFESMRWVALNFKRAWDNLLIGYARRIKPDLILATWNHLLDVAITEERAFLPIDLWGRAENYFWYSGGYGPTKLAEHNAGDGWLDCLYMREFAGGKPFILGKYENVRTRNTIAEIVATGGSGMGLQIGYHDPAGFDAGVQYLRFLHDHKDLYWPVDSYAEVGLLFPRQSIQNGRPGGAAIFRKLGHALIDEHVLFDVVLDQKLTAARLRQYRLVILPGACDLSPRQRVLLSEYVRRGGKLLELDSAERGVQRVKEVAGASLSTFDAPWTLRASAFGQPGRTILHLVNYNRDEERAKKLSGPAAECPIPVSDVGVSLQVNRAAKATLLSPDDDGPRTLTVTRKQSRLEFRIPRIMVYAVVVIEH